MNKIKSNKIIIFILSICLLLVIGLTGYLMFPSSNEIKTTKKEKQNEFENFSFYKEEYLQRYKDYKKEHLTLNNEDIVTLVNMQRDFNFYEKIIKQDKPNEINTLVNKYYQLAPSYQPSDLVEINGNNGTYGSSYSKHTARAVVYDDFQALKKACQNQGFELYVCSGYRSTSWQDEIYNHMVNTYDQETADKTCSRPGHSEHTTGLGLDIALDQYKFEDVVKHPQYQWLLEQLSYYGFIIRYPENKQNLTGYEYEAWHIRYLGKDLAKKVEKSGLTYDEYYAKNF